MTTTTTTEESFITDAINTPLVILGVGEVTPKANHARVALFMGLLAGWIFGIMRGKKAPDSNMLGMAA